MQTWDDAVWPPAQIQAVKGCSGVSLVYCGDSESWGCKRLSLNLSRAMCGSGALLALSKTCFKALLATLEEK